MKCAVILTTNELIQDQMKHLYKVIALTIKTTITLRLETGPKLVLYLSIWIDSKSTVWDSSCSID